MPPNRLEKRIIGISTVIVIVTLLAIVIVGGLSAYFVLMPRAPPAIVSTTTSLLQTSSVSTTSSSAPTTALTLSQSSSTATTTSFSSTSALLNQSTSSYTSTSISQGSSSTVASSTGTNNFFNITVTRELQDTPEAIANAKPVYIFNVTIVNTGTQDSNVVPQDFELVGASNTVYSEQNALAMVIPTSIFVSPGQHTKMQVAFALNPGDMPSKIKYVGEYFTNGGSSIVDVSAPLPQIVSNVSDILSLDTNVTGPTASEISVNSAEIQNFSTPANLGYFYTGDIIAIHLNFGYQIGYSGNATFQITGISNSGGFLTVKLTPSVPIPVGNFGVDVMLYLLTPQTSFSGTLVLDITTS